MKKIEQAALNHAPYMLTVDEQARIDFIAGARYVLDAMVSEKSEDVGVFAVTAHRADVRRILAAVRKEIEG